MRTIAVPAAVALLLLAVPVRAEEPAPAAAAAESLAARVNGVGITTAEFERNWQYFLQKSGIPGNHVDKAGQLEEFRTQVVNGLVDEELIAQEAARSGYAALPEEVAAQVAEARAKFPDDEAFQEALAGSGLSAERLAALYARRVGIEKYIGAEITAKTEVSDAEVAEFYRANLEEFAEPEQTRARHILVAVAEDADDAAKQAAREKAEALLGKVRGGADFAEVARESSDCPSAGEGGDLGFFVAGQLVEPFEKAAAALAPGELSGVVETQFGFHVIRVEERKPAGTATEEEAAPQIREFLRSQKADRAVGDRIAQLREKAKIEIFVGN